MPANRNRKGGTSAPYLEDHVGGDLLPPTFDGYVLHDVEAEQTTATQWWRKDYRTLRMVQRSRLIEGGDAGDADPRSSQPRSTCPKRSRVDEGSQFTTGFDSCRTDRIREQGCFNNLPEELGLGPIAQTIELSVR